MFFLAALAVYVVRQREYGRWHILGFALILAGGIGNMIDRVLYGYVVDFMFIDFKLASWTRTNIFNIADNAIVIGFVMLIVLAFRKPKQDAAAEPAQ